MGENKNEFRRKSNRWKIPNIRKNREPEVWQQYIEPNA